MIHNDEREPITVMLDYKSRGRRLRPFYCMRCGKCVCEVTGDGRLVVPGSPDDADLDSLKIGTAIRCGGSIHVSRDTYVRCTAKYFFN